MCQIIPHSNFKSYVKLIQVNERLQLKSNHSQSMPKLFTWSTSMSVTNDFLLWWQQNITSLSWIGKKGFWPALLTTHLMTNYLSQQTAQTIKKRGGGGGGLQIQAEYVLASGCRSIRIEKWTEYNRMMHNFNLKRTHCKQDTNEKVLPLLGEIGSLHFTVNAILLVVSQLMLTISIVNQSRRWSNKNTRAVSSPRQRRPNFLHKF